MVTRLRLVGLGLLLLALAGCGHRRQTVEARAIAAAEERGRAAAREQAALARGAGEGAERDGKAAAEQVGRAVGEVCAGLSKGLNHSPTLNFRLSPELQKLGLQATASHREESEHVSVYLVASAVAHTRLVAKALTESLTEVGRGTAQVDLAAGEAHWVDFGFDPRTPWDAVVQLGLEPASHGEAKTEPKAPAKSSL